MSQTTTEKKKKKQLTFDFSLAKSPDYIRLDNEKERGKIHYLIPKDKVTDKKVGSGNYFRKQTFFNIDFRYGHDGLNLIATQAGINLENLPRGNVVVFFNTGRNQMKIAFSDRGIYHYRQTAKIEERAIDDIIREFNSSGKFSYDDGLAAFLTRRGHRVENSPLN
jgi:hypothetical protein